MQTKKVQNFIQRHTFNGEEQYTEKVVPEKMTEEYTQQQITDATAMYQSFYEETQGDSRTLIDNYAKERIRNNPDAADVILRNPMYRVGKVSHSCNRFRFTGLSTITESSMIGGIDELMNTLHYDKEGSFINQTTGVNKPMHIELVKFAKSIVLGQMSPNEKFSNIVSRYLRELLLSFEGGALVFPITVPGELSTFESIIVKDLNSKYKAILTNNNIEYNEVIEGKKKKRRPKSSNEIPTVEAEIVEKGSALDNLCAKMKRSAQEVIDVE